MDDRFDAHRVRAAYDGVAGEYDAAFGDELDHLDLDASLVDRLGAACVAPVLEVGAGVAPVSRRLAARVVVACDLSAGMLARAPRHAPRVQADAAHLPFCDAAFDGATVRYVLQHVERDRLPEVIAEVRRVVRTGGVVLVAVHLGQGAIELSELLGRTFEPIGGAFHERDEIVALLTRGSFELVEEHERAAAPGEAPTRRWYGLARAVDPGGGGRLRR